MAFKSATEKQVSQNSQDGQKPFNPFILYHPSKQGRRLVRFFPESFDGLDPVEPEIGQELWIDAMGENGKSFKVRIWLADGVKWKLPEDLQKKVRNRYLFNVWDRTKVVSIDGSPVYPDLKNNFAMAGTPKEHNRVMILEVGYGLFQSINLLDESVFDEDGNAKRLVEFDVAIVRSGEALETTYQAKETAFMRPITREQFDAPRYKLSEYMRTMNYDMVTALLNGTPWESVAGKDWPTRPELETPF